MDEHHWCPRRFSGGCWKGMTSQDLEALSAVSNTYSVRESPTQPPRKSRDWPDNVGGFPRPGSSPP
jgi:hypothetical protein